MRWIWYCTLLAYIAFLLGLIYTIIIDYDDKNPVERRIQQAPTIRFYQRGNRANTSRSL